MEAVFASFLLITSILISVYVFDSSLRAEANNEQRITAAIVAESALEEIRSFANKNFPGTRSTYHGRNWTLPHYSVYQISAKVEPMELPLPCTELETQYPEVDPPFPTPERRVLAESVLKCEVAVRWSRGRDELRMVRYVANFTRASNFQVVINPSGTEIDPITSGTFDVAPWGTKDFSAKAYVNGVEVDDIQFSWYVEPLNGFGSIYRESRDGKTCRYRNAYRNYDGTYKRSAGLCDVVVRAVYQGTEAKRKVRIKNG